jgi:crotonobetainyl-CoA:carnitine CoA-transferase CaiB-like acyl-CoA transferase
VADLIDLPLAGVRVLDCVPGVLGAVGRFLGELGADVIRVERPGDRNDGACVAGVSLRFAAANLGKRVVVLDPARDQAEFEALVGDADILLRTTTPVTPAASRGLASCARQGSGTPDQVRGDENAFKLAELHRLNPALVVVSFADFGRDGPWAGWRASDAVLHALTGGLSRSGLAGRAPLLPPGELTYHTAAAQIAFGTLAALIRRLRTGEGDHVDVSLLEAGMQALDPGFGLSGSAQSGVPFWKMARGRTDEAGRYPIVPCADGHVRLCIMAPRQWRGMFRWLGEPAAFAGAEWERLGTRFRSAELVEAYRRFFANRTRAQIEAEAEAHGVPAAALLDLSEAPQTPQMRARGAFADVEIAPGVSLPFPAGQIEIDGVRAGPRGGVPQPGAARFEEDRPTFAPPPAADRPLAGVRVLDLGIIVVGGETGRLLADLGAEVVKVENAAFPDGQRQSRDDAAVSLTFAAGHRNKRGLAIDLRSGEGRTLFLELVREADVLLSNFKPGTLEALGLGRGTLAAANPRLVTVDSSAFGPTGPWSRRLGYGPLVRCSTGLARRWTYPGEPGGFGDAITVYPDHVAARIGACGALALLIRRMRTGDGGSASVAQAEVMIGHMAAEIAALAAGASAGDAAEDLLLAAAGDDEWVVVTLADDADRARLAELCGGDPAGWVAARAPAAAAADLQAAGLAAGWMVRVVELPALPGFVARGTFREATHPLIDHPFLVETTPVTSERIPVPEQRPAPRIGEDSLAVLADWLGRDAHDLLARGIIEQAA